jgi:SAM-dependent methyltransferase
LREASLNPGINPQACLRDPAASLLFGLLGEQDIADVERRIAEQPALDNSYRAATPELRRFLILSYGLWLGVASVSEKTGLSLTQPPEDIHSMARGPLAAAGGLYEADLIAGMLASADVDITRIGHALDFGCSSGRVARVMAAAYPHIALQACDPNASAIAWAREHLPWIDFFISPNAPPLEVADASLDLVYAISIWSHFAPRLGLRWFEEMRRVLKPGSHLVCTTHGLTSIDYYADLRLRTPEQSREIADALYGKGWWYAAEFGKDGDWGVVDPEWGTAFLSTEWMLAQLCPRWRVVQFAPGRNQDNQDVYVLQRV